MWANKFLRQRRRIALASIDQPPASLEQQLDSQRLCDEGRLGNPRLGLEQKQGGWSVAAHIVRTAAAPVALRSS